MFGIGAGKLNLSVDKTTFLPGDTLNVNIELTLNSEIKANGVFVSFYGLRKVRKGKYTKTEKIYIVTQTLDHQKIYAPGTYNYTAQIQIPTFQIPKPEGIWGTVFEIAKMFSSPVTWHVEAKLDIPLGFDVSNKVMLKLEGEQLY